MPAQRTLFGFTGVVDALELVSAGGSLSPSLHTALPFSIDDALSVTPTNEPAMGLSLGEPY
eukprot:12428930-Karenia_brevis.AAC.1